MTSSKNATALTQFAAIVAKALETNEKTLKAVETLEKARVMVFEGFIALVKDVIVSSKFEQIKDARETFALLPQEWQKKILGAKAPDGKRLKSLISVSPDEGKIYIREKSFKSANKQDLLKWVGSIENPFNKKLVIAESSEKQKKSEKSLLETAESKLSSLSKLLKWFETTSGKPISSLAEAEKIVSEMKQEIENIKQIEQQTAITPKPKVTA